MSTHVSTHIQKHTNTHLAGSTIHRLQIFGELFPDVEIHVEVLEGGYGADLHGSCGRVVGDVFGGLQQTHNLPQSKINIWNS